MEVLPSDTIADRMRVHEAVLEDEWLQVTVEVRHYARLVRVHFLQLQPFGQVEELSAVEA